MEQKAKAHADVDRLTTLATNGILTEKDKSLVAAQAVDREFTLKIDRAQEELQQLESSAQVVVPVDGQIIRLLVRDGTDVSEDELLAVLSVPADVAIEAAVFPKPGIRLHAGLTANVSLDLPTKPPRQLGVDYLLPSCDPHTGATIIGIIPKGDVGPLRLGQRVRIELLGDETETVIVPSSAVVSRAGKTYCVKRSGKSWQAVEVTVVGSNTAGDVYLSSGLRPGDDVMTEGAYAVIYRDFRELFTFED
jgi:multidrug efflux pump subunit AcrA (membrane-fusion protein)